MKGFICLAAALFPIVAVAQDAPAFTIAVAPCWNIVPGSPEAQIKVVVGFALDRDGKVVGDVRLVSAEGDAAAAQNAFMAARRAVLRCQGADGFPLPVERYDKWREMELTFDPAGVPRG